MLLANPTWTLGRRCSLVDREWGSRMIEAVGDHGGIFDRHLGNESRLKFERGINEPWTEDGLMCAPPAR